MPKIAGKSLVFMVGSPLATIGIFDPTMDETADEIDVTDSESTGAGREYLSGYEGRTISYAKWYLDDDTPLVLGDTDAFSWAMGSKTLTGNLLITGRSLGATREDAHRWNYTARITGTITLA